MIKQIRAELPLSLPDWKAYTKNLHAIAVDVAPGDADPLKLECWSQPVAEHLMQLMVQHPGQVEVVFRIKDEEKPTKPNGDDARAGRIRKGLM